MNRNTNAHFAELPSVDVSRSTFDRSFSHKFSGNTGDIIPIFIDEILPGDTVSIDTSKVVRFQTLLTPMMDNLYADVYWFFVPNRLLWDHWINLMGENTDSAWLPQVQYSVPQIIVPPAAGEGDTPNNNKVGTLLDYLGYPVAMSAQTDPISVSALPIRAYCKVMNDWFRSENLTDPINLYTGDAAITANTSFLPGSTTDVNYIDDVAQGGLPFKAAKFADYFTRALPNAQKGEPVTLAPLITVDPQLLPVFTLGQYHGFSDWSQGGYEEEFGVSSRPAIFGNTYTTQGVQHGYLLRDTSSNSYRFKMSTPTDETSAWNSYDGTASPNYFEPQNLYAPLDGFTASTTFTVNDLRLAFQMQKLLERDARGGTRYIETIKSHFGVTSPDARLQRSEYLGGNRFPIQVNQVSNQAQTEQDFLGDLGAYSVTTDVHSDFTKSFVEHGLLLGLMVVRHDHTYCQGIEKLWTRKDRYSYYWPVLANIGEQPIDKSEIFGPASGTFGYQEAWADYRFKPNRVSGFMRPYVPEGLFSWTLADDYETAPSLSDEWLREGVSSVDRVLAVTSMASHQFWADFYFDFKHTRPMPVYSVPGLIDHN